MFGSLKLSPRARRPTSGPGSTAGPERTPDASPDPGDKWRPPPTGLLSLPPEIHLVISQMLIYPDALSLKHTNSHFYSLVDTGVNLKVDWLVQRRSLHLECPSDRRCDLGSDLRFCRGSVPLLMQRRREHIECESKPGLGCIVFDTRTCAHRRENASLWRRCLKTRLTVELWWVLLAMVPLLFCWIWMLEMLRD